MPAINLSFKDKNFSLGITKFERKKVYGYTSVVVKDDSGSNCGLASISEDGKHLLSKGCVGYTYINDKNEFVPSSSIKVVDENGEILEKLPSSFDLDTVELEEANLNDFFQLAVKSVYQLSPEEEGLDLSALKAILEQQHVLRFKFNYRADYDPDDAFLLNQGDAIFMVIGQVSPFEFIGLETTAIDVATDDAEEEEEDFDFGML